jgi:hypothetical protein
MIDGGKSNRVGPISTALNLFACPCRVNATSWSSWSGAASMRDLFRGLGVSPLIWLASIWLASAAIVFALLYGCTFLMEG